MTFEDTIAAISTAVSESGIGIIRISGDQAIEIADRVFCSKKKNFSLLQAPAYTIHYGYIVDREQEKEEVIDEVLVSVMRGPHSFTAEDTAEINCHGGVYAMKRILEVVLKAGAKPAQPGEFTKRAFLNGRIDLSQAEAVMDVIQAKNEYALKSSVRQLKGSVQRVIEELRKEILYETAKIESALDDPEHYSLEGYSDQLEKKNREWTGKIQKLIDTSANGRIIREGILTAIVGRPNAGKSSLLNALLGEERAIVTEVEGTTRDILTETLQIGEVCLNIMDTAGIRETEDYVESIGVDRAKKGIRDADLILYVADASGRLGADDEEIMRLIEEGRWIAVLNKTDLEQVTTRDELVATCERLFKEGKIRKLPDAVLEISARQEKGLEILTETIRNLFFSGSLSFNDEVIITNVRHRDRLLEAKECLEKVKESILLGMPEDFYAIDLTGAYTALGEITGAVPGDDLANEIFGKFCMGK